MRRLTFKQPFNFPRTYWDWYHRAHHDLRVMKPTVTQSGANGSADDRKFDCIADEEFEIHLAFSR